MLDQQILRNNLEALKSNLERRGLDIDIDFLVQQDEKRRAIKFEGEQARSDHQGLKSYLLLGFGLQLYLRCHR